MDALSPANDGERYAAESLVAELQQAFATLPVDELASLLRAIEGGGGGGGGGDSGHGGHSDGGELARLPVAREVTTAADLREMLQMELAAAQPAASEELRAHLHELEAKAAHLESMEEEMAGLAADAALDRIAALKAELLDDEALAQALADRLGVDLGSEVDGGCDGGGDDDGGGGGGGEGGGGGGGEGNNEGGERRSERFRLLGELPQLNLKQGPRGRTVGTLRGEEGRTRTTITAAAAAAAAAALAGGHRARRWRRGRSGSARRSVRPRQRPRRVAARRTTTTSSAAGRRSRRTCRAPSSARSTST